MDFMKKQRRILRGAFTKAHTAFVTKVDGGSSDAEQKVAFQLLEAKMHELDAIHSSHDHALFESEMTEEDIAAEIETNDIYKALYLGAKIKMEANTISSAAAASSCEPVPHISTHTVATNLRLPKIELAKFGGGVHEWLPFWSQFKKVHGDPALSPEDKFQYLLQCTVPESKARELVASFPPTAENYQSAVNCIKDRFGRDDYVVEYYVRGLLSLVLKNAVTGSNKVSLSSVYDKVAANIRALNSLGVTTDKCAAMLYPLVESSLPIEILRAWQRSGQMRDVASNAEESKDRLSRLLEFLQAEVENEQQINLALTGFDITSEDKMKKVKRSDVQKDIPSASVLFVNDDKKVSTCVFCSAQHHSQACEEAKKMTVEDKKGCLRKANVCFICLSRGHFARQCRVKVKCSLCARKHATVMCHLGGSKNPQDQNKSYYQKSRAENNLVAFSKVPEVCLQTLCAVSYSDTCEKLVRVVLDTASQRSYICSDIAQELGYVSKDKQEVIHSLFGGIKSESMVHDSYTVRLRNLENTYACNFSAMDHAKICDTLPCVKKGPWLEELGKRNISLSDIDSGISRIDILIGADVMGKLLTGEKYNLKNGLTAFETLLGWTVMGKYPVELESENPGSVLTNMLSVQYNITDLWRLDAIGITDPIEKVDQVLIDKQITEFINNTARIDEEGRYEISLPFIEHHMPMSSNLEISRSRLLKTCEKLKGQSLFGKYDEVIREWVKDGVAERVPESEMNSLAHYLPHRAVVKTEGTFKIRPVFDASATKAGFPSLNQCLEKGPNLIELVPTSLIHFRENNIGVISDIKRAFLQVGVNEKDRDYLRFFWESDGDTVMLRHKRLVFGLACSPFLLAIVIEMLLRKAQETALADSSKWSEQSVVKLQTSFYVDNCVTSVKSKDELICFKCEATNIMASGGFDLRGWESSRDGLKNRETKVLGLQWNKVDDVMSINPEGLIYKHLIVVTKRTILSMAHRMFDPIGFTCPVTLQPKLILQELWNEKIEWDTELVGKHNENFVRWMQDLHSLREIRVKRELGEGTLTIHTFCDASAVAYAAAVFSRVENRDYVKINLLGAKSRIAPKNSTIPRLELMAATIAVRLTLSIVKAFNRKVCGVTYWSDSTTVLAWIARDLQWSTFVCNRVREIRTYTLLENWRYVPSELNPADLPSRGCNPLQLLKSQWWLGPTWLSRSEKEWPVGGINFAENECNHELRKSVIVNVVNIADEEFSYTEFFSSYSSLIRCFALMRHFADNCRNNIKNKSDTKLLSKGNSKDDLESSGFRRIKSILSFKELWQAECIFLKHLQDKMFNDLGKSKLTAFKTMVNGKGLYVLKTKIFNRKDDYNFLCPILLDGKNKAIYLLVRETHEMLGHAGTQIIMNHLREKFWIIGLRRLTKRVIGACVTCKKQSAKHMECEAPPLPLNRVRDAAVFEVSGVDFAGPIYLKGQGKGWICIFTCAVYRAVHLELASSLSTEGFMECLRRFVARRGRPKMIYSDNGTNFRGVANAFNKLDWEKIAKNSSALRIEWYFNPPSAPWWGGWWERLIGVLKIILRKVLGRASLSYESMNTTLCDAEAIINSRPLTYVSEDPEDLKPLSPSLFLQEIKQIGVPDCDELSHVKLNQQLKYRQKIFCDLRVRFRTEYLSQLLLKNSKKETRTVNIGDVVLIGDTLSRKRIDWPLARVVDIIRGRDGNARVYVLKVKSGFCKRPIQRIYPLEISGEQTQIKEQLCEKIATKNACTEDTRLNIIDADLKQNEMELAKKVSRSGRIIQQPKRLNY